MNKNTKIAELCSNNKWVIYIMAFLIGSAMGIIIPLTSTHMSKNNVSNTLIGVISSVYFFTIAFGTIFINKKMKNKDLKSLISLGLFISSICTLVFPRLSSGLAWFILMALMGLGVSFHLVGTQTALHSFSDDNTRGIVSGVYTLFFALGFASGIIGGPKMYESYVWLPFIVGATSLLIAALMMHFKIKDKLTISTNSNKQVIKKVSLSLQGAFSYGFIENTIAALYPLFLLQSNFSLSQMGYALGMFVIGGISGTLPITYISDRIGREKGLIISVLISILSIVGIVQFNNLNYILIFSFIAGVGVGAIYPVSLALAAQGLDSEEIISATSMFTFFYGFGSGAGPLLSSFAMDRLGNNYLFSLSLVLLVILLPHLFGKVKNLKYVN
ncbi:MFS transporter [Clostridium sp. DJ247]|uniref:MFS transporter n=1 Tax=Clostridium sp. DJ247 TaxID=2726188 RepID=UPI00162632F2|nr:MFS transporter [Clostridium sp. DJ247]MBC2578805.1 MFS transporter [Clostridium sp. DJ247]